MLKSPGSSLHYEPHQVDKSLLSFLILTVLICERSWQSVPSVTDRLSSQVKFSMRQHLAPVRYGTYAHLGQSLQRKYLRARHGGLEHTFPVTNPLLSLCLFLSSTHALHTHTHSCIPLPLNTMIADSVSPLDVSLTVSSPDPWCLPPFPSRDVSLCDHCSLHTEC